ncbi:MAG: VCBS repeat-containing protein, partial [Acidobacteriota bacterium]
NLIAINWGQAGDTPAPGDYDGDGKADFVVRRPNGGAGNYYKYFSNGTFGFEVFGTATAQIVPGDYDGDGRTDICTFRPNGGTYEWSYEPSGTAGTTAVTEQWGFVGQDLPAQGDYNGDGQTEFGVYRIADGNFWSFNNGSRAINAQPWGAEPGDVPAAGYNTH